MASLSFTAPARATVAPASSSRRNVAMMSSSKVLQAEVRAPLRPLNRFKESAAFPPLPSSPSA